VPGAAAAAAAGDLSQQEQDFFQDFQEEIGP